ncbi:uncharacterized membrane protein YciS (DUF1049 family) [Arthrobacter sp. UYCu511]|uniref:hypothetical protein n=1 Tax=Arthrobacter sp. UYCu511 TaxID=3156337 RepID=UPI003399D449
MTDSVTPPTAGGSPSSLDNGRRGKMPVWLVRTIIGAIAIAVLVIVYLIASVTVPLMWANSIRGQIGGQLGNSIPLGMFYGFVFTFVPVLIAWQAHRRAFNKWVRLSLVALGLVLLIPNLLTLGVLYGSTQSAANARSIWANSANWFGTWSQVFMVVGVVCAVALIVLGRMWLRRSKKLREVKAAEKIVRQDQQERERASRQEAKTAARAGHTKPAPTPELPGTTPVKTTKPPEGKAGTPAP